MEMQAVSTLETHLIESCHEEGGHCLKQARCVAFGLVMLNFKSIGRYFFWIVGGVYPP